MSLSLLPQQRPACFAWFTGLVSLMGVCTATASRICSEHHTAFLCSSHLAFPPDVLLKPKWCNHTVVLTQLQARKFKKSAFLLL